VPPPHRFERVADGRELGGGYLHADGGLLACRQEFARRSFEREVRGTDSATVRTGLGDARAGSEIDRPNVGGAARV
jgi:hypothetical protein